MGMFVCFWSFSLFRGITWVVYKQHERVGQVIFGPLRGQLINLSKSFNQHKSLQIECQTFEDLEQAQEIKALSNEQIFLPNLMSIVSSSLLIKIITFLIQFSQRSFPPPLSLLWFTHLRLNLMNTNAHKYKSTHL